MYIYLINSLALLSLHLLFYILIFLLSIILISKYDPKNKNIEGFKQSKELVVKTGPEIYDTFYVNMYDDLVYNKIKNDFEFISNKLSIDVEELQSYMDMDKKTYKDYKSQQNIYNIGAKTMKIFGFEMGGKR